MFFSTTTVSLSIRTKSPLILFVAWFNNLHPTISFTFEVSDTLINFLDTTVYLTQQCTLAVKPYVKKTDMNTYLLFSSFHPRHLRSNIPLGQFLRIKRNSTNCINNLSREVNRAETQSRQSFLHKVMSDHLQGSNGPLITHHVLISCFRF